MVKEEGKIIERKLNRMLVSRVVKRNIIKIKEGEKKNGRST
jgi:hypothetical protein